mgnify:CR=1 FL=1
MDYKASYCFFVMEGILPILAALVLTLDFICFLQIQTREYKVRKWFMRQVFCIFFTEGMLPILDTLVLTFGLHYANKNVRIQGKETFYRE